MSPKAPKEKDNAEVTCPVCAGIVTLDDPFCPHCGAEFEAEEVEEVVEEELSTVDRTSPEEHDIIDLEPTEEPFVEAKEEPAPSETMMEEAPLEAPMEESPLEISPEPVSIAEPEESIELEEVKEAEEEPQIALQPKAEFQPVHASLTDLKVVGITLLILGMIGAIIMINIRWFWLWVPNMEQNLILYAAVGGAIILVSYLMVRKMGSDSDNGKAPPHPILPSVMLSMILFGFISIVMFVLAKPINQALKSSNIGPSAIFIAMVVIGLLIYIYQSRVESRAATEAA